MNVFLFGLELSGVAFPKRLCESTRMPKRLTPPQVPPQQYGATQEAFAHLEPLYGPVHWEPRYDAISELVFTILSQHTSDLNSEKAFQRLIDSFGSWEAVAQSDDRFIVDCIRIGGLAQIKAPRIKEVLNQIIELKGHLDLEFLNELPMAEAKSWLQALPGVGPKTAAIVLCFAFGMPAMPVDTHIHRVSQRLGLIGPKITADQAHDLLEELVNPEQVFPFHVYLITHGRQVCKAQRPLCEECVLLVRCPEGKKRTIVQG